METELKWIRPCGLDVATCDSVCSMDEWLRCADSHTKYIPQRIVNRIRRQKEVNDVKETTKNTGR